MLQGKVNIEKFLDGEIGVLVLENVRGRNVFIVQSTARHSHFYLIELLILLMHLSAITAKLVGSKVLTMGLHTKRIQEFFGILVDNLYACSAKGAVHRCRT